MSNNFHAGPNGPGKCTASKQACPFGGQSGSENHYESFEEAAAAFEAKNSDQTIHSMRKTKSASVTTSHLDPIDLKFSDKEISEILERHPDAIVLEPGRYMQYETAKGATQSSYGDDREDYSQFAGMLKDSENISDEDVLAYASESNLNADHLRFMRDLAEAERKGEAYPFQKGKIEGDSARGYSLDQSFLDADKLRDKYPGMFNRKGAPMFLNTPTFELNNKAPVISAFAKDNSNDSVFELREELIMKGTGETISPVAIGDPTTGKGTFPTSVRGWR